MNLPLDKRSFLPYFYIKLLTHDYIHYRLDDSHHVWGQDPQRGLTKLKWLIFPPKVSHFTLKMWL